MRAMIACVFLVLISTLAWAEVPVMSGVWTVEDQYSHSLGTVFAGDVGLRPFVGTDKTAPLANITFLGRGQAVIALSDGTVIDCFARPTKLGLKIQPQGGGDTEIYLQTMTDGKVIGAMLWEYPDGEYNQLILIFQKVEGSE